MYVLKGAEMYKNDLPSYFMLEGELSIWKNMWTTKELPTTPAKVLTSTQRIYPTLEKATS